MRPVLHANLMGRPMEPILVTMHGHLRGKAWSLVHSEARFNVTPPPSLENEAMLCYTTVRTTITDLALAIESARKLGWTVEKNPQRLGQDVSAALRTLSGTLQLRQTRDGTYRAQGVPRGTVTELVRTYAEEGVMKWAKSKGYFAQIEVVGTKRVLTLRSYGG